MKHDLLRDKWPVVRVVLSRGVPYYQVDPRRKGSSLKRETYQDQQQALKRAETLAAELEQNGVSGVAMPALLREWALQGEAMLKPWGKTILQACEFYRDHLKAEETKKGGATVVVLAGTWYDYKASGEHKKLRKATLTSLEAAKALLIKAFPTQRITEVTKKDVNAFLAKLGDVSMQYKANVVSQFSQFFNWCIKEHALTANPCSEIEIIVEKGDVEIWKPELAAKAMLLAEQEFQEFVLFHALGLFGGLRPQEAMQLTWENVHLEGGSITVLSTTTKVKETRPVPINATLKAWLIAYKPKDTKGLVVRGTNFTNHIKSFRSRLGYRYDTKRGQIQQNPNGPLYVQDVLRHSYGSYWLAKHKNRNELAEDMGNSVDVIKKHYRKHVPEAEYVAYWQIMPTTTLQPVPVGVSKWKRGAMLSLAAKRKE